MKSGKLKRFLTNLGLILASLGVGLLLLEVALRFTPYKQLLQRRADWAIRDYYRADAAKGFDIRPNVGKIRTSVDNRSVAYDLWSNELGCFDEPYRGEKDLILLVGDSFTHANAPFEDKWGTRIEKLLNYRVLKAGVTAYGTRQELLKAREILAQIHRSPRLIIVGYFWNDLTDDYNFPGVTVVDGLLVDASPYKDKKTGQLPSIEVLNKPYSLWEKLTGNYPMSFQNMLNFFLDQHFISVNLISDARMKLFPQKFRYADPMDFPAFYQEPWIEQAWVKHEENLKAFKELAASQGAELLVVMIPTNTQVYPFLIGDRKIDLERPNRTLIPFLRQEQIRYLDLLPLFRHYADETPRERLDSKQDLYWRANSHWSIKGEHLAGMLVSRYILENNLVQVQDREKKLKEIEEKLDKFQ
jgi:hypothetical protein